MRNWIAVLLITLRISLGFVPLKLDINTKARVSTQEVVSTESCLNALLTRTELPEKLYFEKEKETPKVLGGLKIGLRKLVVVTGASSGLGLKCAATLAKTGRYFVVMACRDVEKGKRVAKKENMPEDS